MNLKVEGELLPRPEKAFTGRTRLRGLLGQNFPRQPYFDCYFVGRSVTRDLLEMLLNHHFTRAFV